MALELFQIQENFYVYFSKTHTQRKKNFNISLDLIKPR